MEKVDYIFVDGWQLSEAGHFLTKYFEQELGIRNIISKIVPHSFPTYAAVVEHNDGWKLVYSADTRPYKELIEVRFFLLYWA